MSKLIIYRDKAGEYRYRLVADNGEGILPPESHTTASDALRAFDRLAEILAGESFEVEERIHIEDDEPAEPAHQEPDDELGPDPEAQP